jgi:hypothetical protein
MSSWKSAALAEGLTVQAGVSDLWARAGKTPGDFSETPLTNFFSPPERIPEREEEILLQGHEHAALPTFWGGGIEFLL